MFAEVHVEHGRIRAVLPSEGGTTIRTESATHYYPGGHIMPGFVDSHAHLYGLGLRLLSVSLHAAGSIRECVDACSSAVPLGGWVRAMGWNQEQWPGRQYPTALDLDAAVDDRPVIARRVDGHALWCNSAAMRIAGITFATPDPSGGRILRDDNGHPSGIFIDAAMELIEQQVPKWSSEELQQIYLQAANHCAEHGITEVHDMDVAPEWLDAQRELAERGALAVRVQSYVSAQHDEWEHAGLLPAGGEFLRICGIKLFADGALGSRGAFLLAPYHDEPSTSGIQLLTTDRIVEAAQRAIEAGWWSIGIHAIGDAANRLVLDAYARVRALPGGEDVILRIEHAQHVHPDDVPRFAELNVVAMVQPTHCLSDATMAEHRLGNDRLPWSYRWRSLLDAGARISGGSDFPIEAADPFAAIDAFCMRTPAGQTTPWQPQERLHRDEAIKALTTWPHEVSDVSFRRGKIAEGFDADFVVLDRDVTTCSDHDVALTVVMATFTGGKIRYQRTPL